MKAIQFVGEGQYRLVDLAEPTEPPNDGVIVEVEAVGICGTDLRILTSPMQHDAKPGIVLGHEIAGVVAAVGSDVTSVSEGDHVAIDPAKNCGLCRVCRRGIPESCPNKIVHGIFEDGGLRRLAPLPEWSLVPIDDSLPWRKAALVEPLSCVLAGISHATPVPGESAAVFGGGPIGLLYAAVLSSMGVEPVVVYEPHAARRELALGCGVSTVLEGGDFSAELWSKTTGRNDPPSYVVDAVGTLLDPAAQLVDLGGRIVIMGYNILAQPQFNQSVLVEKIVSVHAANGGFRHAAAAARTLEIGKAKVDPIVAKDMDLEDFDVALDEMRAGRVGKVVVRPSG
jgi:threonine dehydrogenase-like Zn-dependent dehydrogenase